MENPKRPRSRKKKVTEGGGNAYKRGEGVSSGGPVGKKDGYSERTGGRRTAGKTAAGQARGAAGDKSALLGALAGAVLSQAASSGSGSGKKGGGSGLKKLLRIVLIVAVIFLVVRYLTGGLGEEESVYSDPLDVGAASETLLETDDPSAAETAPAAAETQDTLSGAAEPTEISATVSNKARNRYTTIQGGGADTFTIMVYMCGTDLESSYGMGTSDLNEMLQATVSEKINLIVQTGGCKKWKNSVVSNSALQRYQIKGGKLYALDENAGRASMTDPGTLSDYIAFCKKNYPADRYALIMWDHGGGSLSGYGYDELYANSGSMALDELYGALKKGGCKFDFIGFDACLMATLETAVAMEPYADYLIASEETEPGCGWYYTNWLTKLSKNTSLPTVEIGKNIIDDFVDVCYSKSPTDKTTLSIVDLAEFAGTVPEPLNAFAQSTSALVDSENYRVVSDARSSCREFAQSSKINQVDLIHLAKNLGTKEADALAAALSGAIKYNRTSRSMTNAYGVSVYFPYERLSNVSNMLSVYDGIGMDAEYGSCIKSFASIVAGGQVSTSPASGMDLGAGSLLGSLLNAYVGGETSSYGGGSSDGLDMTSLLTSFLGGGDFSSLTGDKSVDWVDRALIERNIENIAAESLSPDRLQFTEAGGQQVLALTEDEWSRIRTIELNVFYDDGAGYIDLGLDNTFDYDESGNLIAAYDGTWLALNGQVVCYYLMDTVEAGDAYSIRGYVPALLNGTRVELVLLFDDKNPDGVVSGARRVYDAGETDTVSRGLIELTDGDVIDFLCDYYDYEGNYTASYRFGDPLTVDGTIEISNVRVGDGDAVATYRLTDRYDNHYWTPRF